ncbi:YheC/YheD family protein [Neobacillus sp. YIM B02564]|jgi:glutathione synthase/RimK-type ligase-like ATP-grasp enzyme|uniref:YheC/YheD family protein n=1 Tax=Neobacillus paridis TaxID=2803862 RepID=A0ABS1TUV8_9BACI|nr:YheC/YheD family protein [Neobacillus paridis]MBL4955089.1 YheC/YheD family protein [Neobacillus paridis]
MSVPLTSIMISIRKAANQNDRLIQMSQQLLEKLNITNTQNLYLSLGKTIVSTNIQTMAMAENEIILPENITRSLHLPNQRYKFQAIYRSNTHTLKLGPVIALLTNFHINNEDPHFRTVHKFCEELHQVISKNGGFFYVFSYKDFSTKGFFFQNEKWIPAELPLPDVIYNRIHSRQLEQKIKYKQFRQQLELLMIPLFNDRFLSKLEVYEHLKKEVSLFSAIPETKIFSKENLYEFVQKYDTVFIKPIHGSQGKNILKISKHKDNSYFVQSSVKTGKEPFEKPFFLEELYQRLKPELQNRIYIIQQGVSLITKDLRPMDFRVLCHKHQPTRWEITSIIARVGAEQEIVSNLARGGTIMRPLEALINVMDIQKAKECLAQMKQLALEIAAGISTHSAGIIAELGIDIGVDSEGKPWLIEVNSKPSKSFAETQGKVRPSARAIVQFCTVLAFDENTEREIG